MLPIPFLLGSLASNPCNIGLPSLIWFWRVLSSSRPVRSFDTQRRSEQGTTDLMGSGMRAFSACRVSAADTGTRCRRRLRAARKRKKRFQSWSRLNPFFTFGCRVGIAFQLPLLLRSRAILFLVLWVQGSKLQRPRQGNPTSSRSVLHGTSSMGTKFWDGSFDRHPRQSARTGCEVRLHVARPLAHGCGLSLYNSKMIKVVIKSLRFRDMLGPFVLSQVQMLLGFGIAV